MIDKINIKNFKSLKDVTINPRRLNVLSGLNGMGKSSVIQTLLLLRQSDSLYTKGQLKLKGSLSNIGAGRDALYQFADSDSIEMALNLSDGQAFKWSFICKAEWDLLQSDKVSDAIPVSDPLTGLHYLSADRLGPQTSYEMSWSSVENGDLGTRGEYAVHYLQANGRSFKINAIMKHRITEDLSLINQVNGWLGEISPGVKANIVEIPGVDKMILTFDFELGSGRTNSFRPNNVGFGISFSLAVIVTLLTATPTSVIIIENPEAHLHPRGQAELGKLMALCASTGAQVFVETHSDHIINGIRVSVRDKLVAPSAVNICWFSKVTTTNEQYTMIKEIHVDRHGELSDYPTDFMDEWNNQLLRLV
jgi:predicted ATPase